MSNITHYKVRGLEDAFVFSQAVRAGDTIYLSGHLSWDADGNTVGHGDMAAQVENIYRELGETLAAHGLTFAAVVKENVYTTDMPALVAAADRRKRHYDGLMGPAATWVEVKRLVPDGAMIEVELIAVTR
jgi:enamine deaminase RidA (YjgF/YER057c/UK114 family)